MFHSGKPEMYDRWFLYDSDEDLIAIVWATADTEYATDRFETVPAKSADGVMKISHGPAKGGTVDTGKTKVYWAAVFGDNI